MNAKPEDREERHRDRGVDAHHGHGAKQPRAFDPERAAILDEPERFDYLPPARIFALLEAPAASLVVDFGTGTGAFAIPLAESRPDLTVIALDREERMLALLRGKPAAQRLDNLRPMLTGEMAALAASADRILAVNVLHELDEEALRQMAGLLKPQGFILFVDWDGAVERPVGPPGAHVYTAAEAVLRLASFGLRAEPLAALSYHFVLRAGRAEGPF